MHNLFVCPWKRLIPYCLHLFLKNFIFQFFKYLINVTALANLGCQ